MAKRYLLSAEKYNITKSGRKSRRKTPMDTVCLESYDHEKNSICIHVADSKEFDLYSEITVPLSLLQSFIESQKKLQKQDECAGFELSGEMRWPQNRIMLFKEQQVVLSEHWNWKTTKAVPSVFTPQPGRKFAVRVILTESYPVSISAVLTQKSPKDKEYDVVWGCSLPVRATKVFTHDEDFDFFAEMPVFVFHAFHWHGWIARKTVAMTELQPFFTECTKIVLDHLANDTRVLSFAHYSETYKLLNSCKEEDYIV